MQELFLPQQQLLLLLAAVVKTSVQERGASPSEAQPQTTPLVVAVLAAL
jgi:hypothetical protein